MKLELNVNRFANEDVIATSSTVTATVTRANASGNDRYKLTVVSGTELDSNDTIEINQVTYTFNSSLNIMDGKNYAVFNVGTLTNASTITLTTKDPADKPQKWVIE